MIIPRSHIDKIVKRITLFMKKIIFVLCFFVLAGTPVKAQTWLEKVGENVKEKTVEKVEGRIEEKTDEAIDKGLDKTEEAVKNGAKKGSSNKKNKNSDKEAPSDEANSENETNTAKTTNKNMPQKVDASYAKFDFIRGNEIIFEDDLMGEQKGEFPSKWDLITGGAEIAQINGGNVIALIGFTYITPLFKDKNNAYLPDEFTLEFDVLIDDSDGENAIEFVNSSDEVIASTLFWKESERFHFSWNLKSENEKSGEDTYNNSKGWHHYSLSFNKRAMKVYMDSKRVANIPNILEKPAKVKFFARGSDDNSTLHIKNIHIAKGAVPLYDKLLSDGKIITYGIIFDIAKASIKPESMGTINEIFNILKKYPELKFLVEGHTDNTGNSASNQTLSEARAKAVCDKLKEMGIDASRLSAKGCGMSKPIDNNNTSEGRAKNRRVEFIRL